jgi:hypothetical protein
VERIERPWHKRSFVRWSLTDPAGPVVRQIDRLMPPATTAIHPNGNRIATTRPFDLRVSLMNLAEKGVMSELIEFDGLVVFAPDGQSLIVQKPGVDVVVLNGSPLQSK